MPAKSSLPKLLLLACWLAVSGCAVLFNPNREKNNLLFTDKDIDDIFKAYQKDADKEKERRKVRFSTTIRKMEVVKKENGTDGFLVSVALDNAPLKEVVEAILTKTETPFFLQDVRLAGSVSGRFEKVPFVRALNIILNSEGYSATMSEEGIIFIQVGLEEPSKPSEPAAPGPPAPGLGPAPAPEPGPAGPQLQPSSSSYELPPAMFRRTTLLVQAPGLPPIPGLPPGPGAPQAPGLPPMPGLPPGPGAPGAPQPPQAPGKKQPEVSVEYPLQHLSTESAEKVLARLFTSDGGGAGALPGALPGFGPPATVGPESSGEPLRYGIETTRNTVMIRGPRDQVLKLRKVLQTMDREPQHVLIEVLFLEVTADALENLNFAFKDYADRKISALTTQVGVEGARALQFTFESLARGGFLNLKYTGIFDILYQKKLARVIARPYLASLTGKTSTLKITEDRSIVVVQQTAGVAAASTKDISSGIELKITPTVHLSGSINMQIEVEESEFIPTTGNESVSKNTNRAQNIMQVGSGEAIIIGGLMLNKRQWTKGGLPWLREVPILNVFTARQSRTEVDKEVLVVVTPHLYSPGLRTPLPFLEIFQKDPIIKYTTPTERFEFDK